MWPRRRALRPGASGSTRLAALLAGLVLLLVVGALDAESRPEIGPPRVAELGFMVGCWQGPVGEGTIVRETWTTPLGGMMLGNSQTVSDGTTRGFEYLRIEDTADGVMYRPAPGGRAAASFTLVDRAGDRAAFENPDNDFPQRIVYSLDGGSTLVARIERLDGSGAREFRMSAVPCRGAP